MKKVILLVLLMLCTVNWMYLSENKLKWGGLNPVIGYYMNPEIVGFKSFQSSEERLADIKNAAIEWFLAGESKLSFKLEGFTNLKPRSFETIKCDGVRPDLPQGSALFSFTHDIDSECPNATCVYVWSCNDTIVHTDVEFNNSEFNWSSLESDGDTLNLKTEALKSFGYMLGLGHCLSSDGPNDCLGRTGTDPTPGSVMHKFPEVGKKERITKDEIDGIQAVYGKMLLPFPKDGNNKITDEEIKFIQEQIEIEASAGITSETARQNAAKTFIELSDYATRRSSKDIKAQYEYFYTRVKEQMGSMELEDLKIQRKFLTLGIYQSARMKEDVEKGYLPLDRSYIDYIIQKHLELRTLTIEAIGGR